MPKFIHGQRFQGQNLVIVFDPGETTGYCVLRIDKDAKHIEIVELGEFRDSSQLVMLFTLDDTIARQLCVLFEGFTLFANTVVSPVPMEVIGAIRWITKHMNICTFKQPPSERKVAEKIFRADITKYNSHHLDALLHGLSFCISQYNIFKNYTITHPRQVNYFGS